MSEAARIEPTYTLFLHDERGADEIIARNVGAAEAMSIALDHGRPFCCTVAWRSGLTHRVYEIARGVTDSRQEVVMTVRVLRSSSEISDGLAAADAFAAVFLGDPARFWGGEIMTDEEFLRRSAH